MDTGAAVSILDVNKYKKAKGTVTEYNVKVNSASGHQLNIRGQCKITLELEKCKYEHDVLIGDLGRIGYDGILGMDFLRKYGGVIDIKEGSLRVGKGSGEKLKRGYGEVRTRNEEIKAVIEKKEVEGENEIERRSKNRGERKEFKRIYMFMIETLIWLLLIIIREAKKRAQQVMDKADQVKQAVWGVRERMKLWKGSIGKEWVKIQAIATQMGTGNKTRDKRDLELEGGREDKEEEWKLEDMWPRETKEGELLEMFNWDEVPTEAREPLKKLISEYEDVFVYGENKLGSTDIVKHSIEVGKAKPIQKGPYRVPHAQREMLEDMIQEMLQQEIIAPSTSEWSSPLLLVKKKTAEGEPPQYRPCIDYRALNSVTKKQVFPLPIMDETFDQLGGAKHFSSLDLCNGYWQIQMEEESKKFTAFSTPTGHYECNRLPFGLVNGPAVFMKLMSTVLDGLVNKGCLFYLDDILRYDRTIKGHLEGLKEIFSRLRAAKLKLKPSKCKFFREKIQFLGHVISSKGLEPDGDKVKAIKEFPKPVTVKQLQSFLGLVGYYRKFIKEFSEKSAPLTKLTKKGAIFKWGEEQQEAFENLRECLLEYPVLRFPDFSKPFILTTDGCANSVAGVLSQEFEDGEHMVACASKQLRKEQRAYSATELECLAVVQMFKKFRIYLLGKHFTLRVDHKPLLSLLAMKEPKPKLARWVMEISEYSFSVQHKPGKDIPHVDALSRLPRVELIEVSEGFEPVWDKRRVAQEQARCKTLERLFEKAKDSDSDYRVDKEGVLYKLINKSGVEKFLMCAPDSMKEYIFKICHNMPLGGHMGFEKTLEMIQRQFCWTGMTAEVKRRVGACMACLKRKGKKAQIPIQPVTEVGRPFEKVALDIVGPLRKTKSGNKYILTCQDYFSRYPEAVAIPDQSAETVAKAFIDTVICRHGVPKVILTDRGTNFTSRLMQRVCELLGTQMVFTSPYNAPANGRLERAHQSFAAVISHYVGQDHCDWDEHLSFALFVYRNTRHRITGYSPAFLVYGRDLDMPWEQLLEQDGLSYAEEPPYDKVLLRRLQIAHQQAKAYNEMNVAREHGNKNEGRQLPRLQVGQLVLLRNMVLGQGQSKKLVSRWIGPYRVTRVRSPVTFDIVSVHGNRRIVAHHRNLLPLPLEAGQEGVQREREVAATGDTRGEEPRGETPREAGNGEGVGRGHSAPSRNGRGTPQRGRVQAPRGNSASTPRRGNVRVGSTIGHREVPYNLRRLPGRKERY